MSRAAVDAKFRAEGHCRLCLRPSSIRPLTRHRLIPGSHGGRYETDNCVPLCRPCHDLVDHRDEQIKRSARRMLRASLWPVEVAKASSYGAPTGGWWFEHQYPRPTREAILARRLRAA